MTLHTIAVPLNPASALLIMTEQSKREKEATTYMVGYTSAHHLTLKMCVDGVETVHQVRLDINGTWSFETQISLGEKE